MTIDVNVYLQLCFQLKPGPFRFACIMMVIDRWADVVAELLWRAYRIRWPYDLALPIVAETLMLLDDSEEDD